MDETVLDNSPEEGQRVLDRARYVPDLFHEWVTRAEAAAIPGADDFMRYALRRGVQVYLVTNRPATLKASTVENLARLQLPLGPEFVLCLGERGWEGDKSSRRQFVAAESPGAADGGRRPGRLRVDQRRGARRAAPSHPACSRAPSARPSIDRFSGYWEDRWIVLPNPAYGSWERILYPQTAPDAEQLAKQFDAVRGLSSAH